MGHFVAMIIIQQFYPDIPSKIMSDSDVFSRYQGNPQRGGANTADVDFSVFELHAGKQNQYCEVNDSLCTSGT